MSQQDGQAANGSPREGIAPVEATPFEQHNARPDGPKHGASGCCGSRVSRWVPRLLVVALAAFIVFRLVGGRAAPVPEIFDKSVSLQAALDESAQTGKPVFALLTADWCAPCQSYKRGALSDSTVVATLSEQTVPVYIDMTGDEHTDDARRLVSMGMPVNSSGGISLPTTLMIQDGRVIAPLVGAQSASKLLAWLEPQID